MATCASAMNCRITSFMHPRMRSGRSCSSLRIRPNCDEDYHVFRQPANRPRTGCLSDMMKYELLG